MSHAPECESSANRRSQTLPRTEPRSTASLKRRNRKGHVSLWEPVQRAPRCLKGRKSCGPGSQNGLFALDAASISPPCPASFVLQDFLAMEDAQTILSDFVQLARLALMGRPQD